MVGSHMVWCRQRALQRTRSLRRQAVSATLGWLAGRAQALVASPEARMVADRCQRSHVEHGADPGAATPDAPAPAPGAAVAVEGGDPDQGGTCWREQRPSSGNSASKVAAVTGRCRGCAAARWRGGAGWARPARGPPDPGPPAGSGGSPRPGVRRCRPAPRAPGGGAAAAR